MQKKLVKRNKNQLPLNTKRTISLLISSSIGVAVTFFLTIMLSYFFSKSPSINNSISGFFVAAVVMGSFISGLLSSRLTGIKGIFSGLISSIIFSFIITVIMLFFTGAQLADTTAFMYIANLFFGMVGGIIGANMKRKK